MWQPVAAYRARAASPLKLFLYSYHKSSARQASPHGWTNPARSEGYPHLRFPNSTQESFQKSQKQSCSRSNEAERRNNQINFKHIPKKTALTKCMFKEFNFTWLTRRPPKIRWTKLTSWEERESLLGSSKQHLSNLSKNACRNSWASSCW